MCEAEERMRMTYVLRHKISKFIFQVLSRRHAPVPFSELTRGKTTLRTTHDDYYDDDKIIRAAAGFDSNQSSSSEQSTIDCIDCIRLE